MQMRQHAIVESAWDLELAEHGMELSVSPLISCASQGKIAKYPEPQFSHL